MGDNPVLTGADLHLGPTRREEDPGAIFSVALGLGAACVERGIPEKKTCIEKISEMGPL